MAQKPQRPSRLKQTIRTNITLFALINHCGGLSVRKAHHFWWFCEKCISQSHCQDWPYIAKWMKWSPRFFHFFCLFRTFAWGITGSVLLIKLLPLSRIFNRYLFTFSCSHSLTSSVFFARWAGRKFWRTWKLFPSALRLKPPIHFDAANVITFHCCLRIFPPFFH